MKKNNSYIYERPSPQVNPPVNTKSQLLPFNELSWEDFERLTLRYAKSFGNIEDSAALYGRKGQKQDGIDIYARKNSTNEYAVYQCKRYKSFSSRDIKDAIEEFVRGGWYEKSSLFYLCVSCDLTDTKTSLEIEEQSTRFIADNKRLIVLDRNSFSLELKEHPEIVIDFFGRAWLKRFIGSEIFESLDARLDPVEVEEYKNNLGDFYKLLFDIHESSITNLSGDNSIPEFESRYIVPDVEKSIQIYGSKGGPERKNLNRYSEGSLNDGRLESLEESRGRGTQDRLLDIKIERRIPAVEWLSVEKNSILVGGAGSGKSSLLKYIALSLLGIYEVDDTDFVESRGDLIPVWLPFGYWTSLLERDPNIGLVDCLKLWFEGQSRLDLWPLIEKALSDERLYLLIDGLDEWSNESSAIVCFQKLSVFVKSKNISTIFSSRPSGIERLNISESQWSLASLMGLSDENKLELIRTCIDYRIRNFDRVDPNYIEHQINKTVGEFKSEIVENIDIRELSSIPLMIYMLMHLKNKNISIPHSKFHVYMELITDLVKIHPKRRKMAAQIVTMSEVFNEHDYFDLYSMLAYKIQKYHRHGNVSTLQAKNYFCEYLEDPDMLFGFDKREAKVHAQRLVDIGESEIGILVKKSPDELGFFHRSFQEVLAGFYIATQTEEEQKKLLSKFVCDTQWGDVFLCLFSMLQKQADVESLIQHLKTISTGEYERLSVELLLAKIAFGNNKCSARTAKQISEKVRCKVFDGAYSRSQRRELLNISLSGYSSNKSKKVVEEIISKSMPLNSRWMPSVLESVREHWPSDEKSYEFLIGNIKNDDIYIIRSACSALLIKFGGRKTTFDDLVKLLVESTSRLQRLGIIEILIKGWLDDPVVAGICKEIEGSIDPVEKLLSFYYKSFLGENDLNLKKELLEISAANMDVYIWNDVIQECFVRDCYEDLELRDDCINRVFSGGGRSRYSGGFSVDFDVALEILMKCHWNDPILLEYIIEEFKKERPVFILRMNHGQSLGTLEKLYEASNELRNEVERWMFKHGEFSYQIYRLFKTEKGKEYLISKLDAEKSTPHWSASALLDNWGMNDADIKDALLEYADRDSVQASKISYLYPRIFEPKECSVRLLNLLSGDVNIQKRYDFILQAIFELSDESCIRKAYSILKALDLTSERYNFGSWLMLYFSEYIDDSYIVDVAKENLGFRESNPGLVVRAFKDDSAMRELVIASCTKLELDLRVVVAEFVAKNNYDELCHSILNKYNIDRSGKIKIITSIGFYSSPITLAGDREDLLYRLYEDLSALGIDYQEVRQAAFCGLVELKELAGFRIYYNSQDENKYLGLGFYDDYNVNEYLASYISENWEYIQSSLEGDTFKILGVGGEHELIDYISPYINKNSYFYNGFIDKLSVGDKSVITERNLLSLSKLGVRKDLLLDLCLKALGVNTGDGAMLAALDIIEDRFCYDVASKSYIEEWISTQKLKDDVLLSLRLATGLRNGSLDDLRLELKGKRVWLPCVILDMDRGESKEGVVSNFLDLIQHLVFSGNEYSIYFYKRSIELVLKNEDVKIEMLRCLETDIDVQSKVSILQVLSAINENKSHLLTVSSKLYASINSDVYSKSVFDIVNGGFTAPKSALLGVFQELGKG
jgi:hypothetical protein